MFKILCLLTEKFDLFLQPVVFIKLPVEEAIGLGKLYAHALGGEDVHVGALVPRVLEPACLDIPRIEKCVHKVVHPPQAQPHPPGEVPLGKGPVLCQFTEGLELEFVHHKKRARGSIAFC